MTFVFRLFPFPSERRDPEVRGRWRERVKQADPKRLHLLLQPTKDMRVCSKHFEDGAPSTAHPDPELALGYIPEGKRKTPRERKSAPMPSLPSTSQFWRKFLSITHYMVFTTFQSQLLLQLSKHVIECNGHVFLWPIVMSSIFVWCYIPPSKMFD